jgi:uncharacterized membrane protein YdjX (TVP38/TMEM64 family)
VSYLAADPVRRPRASRPFRPPNPDPTHDRIPPPDCTGPERRRPARRAVSGPAGTRPRRESPGRGTRGWKSRLPWLLAALAVVVVLVLLGRQLGGQVEGFLRWVEGLGAWAPAAFVLGYALATVAFIPGSILSLAAGALFGVLAGAAYVFLGAALGSTAAFLIARYVARARVERWVRGDRRFDAVDRAVADDGRRIVFLLRLSPAFPFNLLNYALGLTRVRLGDYLLAAFGMVPGILLYVYSGHVAGSVAQLAAGAEVERGAGYYAVLALGLLATVGVTVVVTRRARRALGEAAG